MKHCVITGAAQGIGYALAQQFLQTGFQVTGIDIQPCDNPNVAWLQADLSNLESVRALADQLAQRPPIDVLIHNAGINHVAPFDRSDLEQQRRVVAINLIAPIILTEGLFAENSFAQPASIVILGSLSHYLGYPGAAVYAGTKDGIIDYARSLREIHADRLHVLTVLPGPVRTEHARKHSPDNSRESKRMEPDHLAKLIYGAYSDKRSELIPGFGNRIFAQIGKWFPWLTERILCKAILRKLP